ATNIARRMVTQFGMSKVIGPIAVGDREQEIFLGREVVQRREISDRTAQLVDEEVKSILTQAYSDATRILTERRAALDRLAAALGGEGAARGGNGAVAVVANGYVVARTKAAVSAKIPGRLAVLNVSEGSEVQKGDIIARLDNADYVAAVGQAEAQLASAKATL